MVREAEVGGGCHESEQGVTSEQLIEGFAINPSKGVSEDLRQPPRIRGPSAPWP